MKKLPMEMADTKLRKLVGIAFIYKFIIFLTIIVVYFLQQSDIVHFDAHFVEIESTNFSTLFTTWDAQHYLSIAENGYPMGVSVDAAFYPLFPFIIRCLGSLLLGNTIFAGLLFSNICSILAVVYFYLLVKKLYNDTIAFTAALFMLSFITFFTRHLCIVKPCFCCW